MHPFSNLIYVILYLTMLNHFVVYQQNLLLFLINHYIEYFLILLKLEFIGMVYVRNYVIVIFDSLF